MNRFHLTLAAAAIGTALACANAPSAPSTIPVNEHVAIGETRATPHARTRSTADSANMQQTPAALQVSGMPYTACRYHGEQHSGEWAWYTTAGDKKGATKERGVRMWSFGGWACGHTGTELANGTYCGGWGDTHEWVRVTNPCG
ncbi:MAG: hypothetical protein OXG72_19275 [Acidobacteria bacterium]|nr:hypothetical protein [Acidobacteriota bacterium]